MSIISKIVVHEFAMLYIYYSTNSLESMLTKEAKSLDDTI